jgi:hypothetical protein
VQQMPYPWRVLHPYKSSPGMSIGLLDDIGSGFEFGSK